MKFHRLMGLVLLFLSLTALAEAQEHPKSNQLKQIQQELVALKMALDSTQIKLDQLRDQLQKLQQVQAANQQKAELEKLLKEAKDFAREKKASQKTAFPTVFFGGQRQQQALNPNISVTGDFNGHFSDLEAADNRFNLREAEFHIIAPLDPYTRGKFFLGIPGSGHLHVGEAYMQWLNLPFNLQLKVGKFRNQFGILNRWHAHGLPQVDRPRVLTRFLGEEGLSGMGLAFNWLLPKLWAQVNELDLEIISGGDGVSFSAEGTKNWVTVGHFKNYYDLTPNSYLEFGFSGAYGHHDADAKLRTILGGFDLTYKWVPIGRSKYRTFEFRNELILSQRQKPGGNVNTFGLYSYIENKLNARWWAGIRFDYSELPTDPENHEWGISPHLTWWQSEFVFYRLQLSHFERNYGEDETVLWFQSVWSMGPHKHEVY